MDSGYYRAIMVWAWAVDRPDMKLPNGFSKALQENVTAVMNYSMTNGGEGDILWSNGHYDFDPLDPAQSGDNSIMPFLLSLTERTFADPADFQDEVDTIGRRRLTEAQIRRQLSEDEPRWTHHPIFVEPDFPHLDVSACNQPGWSYFLVWVAMETPNDMHRKEFWQVMEDERVQPTMAYPPPEDAGRRLEESFVAEACSEPEFVWSKRIHPAPSVNAAIHSQFPLPLHAHMCHPLLAAAAATASARRRNSGARLHRRRHVDRAARVCGGVCLRDFWAALAAAARAQVQRARARTDRSGIRRSRRRRRVAQPLQRAGRDLSKAPGRLAVQGAPEGDL